MSIEFERHSQTATFHSPLEEFERVSVDVEVREDPLTGRQARVVPESFLLPEEEPDLSAVVEDDEGCFFCPGMVADATPTYADLDVDRGSVGAATSFPNLNPYGSHSNVVALTEDHYRPLDELGAGTFRDGLAAALAYVRAVLAEDPAAEFASVNMNFLRPAGSSLVHPHLQTLVDDRGTTEARRLVDAAREYAAANDRGYWTDLRDAERGGDRHVATTGAVEWHAPFAPKHHFHVRGVLDETGVPAPEDDAVDDVAAGIAAVLDYYAEVGLNSFNLAWHLVDDDPACPPVLDLVGRSVFEEFYWSDSPFFPTLHDEAVVDVAPEQVAADAAAQF